MSFGIADLIAVAVIEDGLEHLSKNPDHLNFILSPFCRFERIRNLVGARHIQDCVEFITKNRVHVAPYYEADMQKIPSVVTVARTGEEQQFIGDYGFQKSDQVFAPIVYTSFDIVGLEEDRTVLFVPKAIKIEEKIWPNVWVANSGQSFRVTGIHVRDDADTRILLDRKVPEGLSFTGWTAQNSGRETGFVVGSDVEGVEVNCRLTTSGDYSVHRLLAIVIRYCLKRGRPLFEAYGLQTTVVSQGMPTLDSDEQKTYSTVFAIKGKLTEHWIMKEFDYPDSSANIDADWIAQSEGKQDVPVE